MSNTKVVTIAQNNDIEANKPTNIVTDVGWFVCFFGFAWWVCARAFHLRKPNEDVNTTNVGYKNEVEIEDGM